MVTAMYAFPDVLIARAHRLFAIAGTPEDAPTPGL